LYLSLYLGAISKTAFFLAYGVVKIPYNSLLAFSSYFSETLFDKTITLSANALKALVFYFVVVILSCSTN